eukprot:CAMPEP_0196197794 /NCGR_PEP_ID=MMETSP0912-20130531/2122_1 /TAXON_ID=49265 /ORGANISM="Thalassiosira rotula, Strain GSO102" /LENGTH=47 /DNA_ID= /DNA_START= /DNA_END= /DNA_ORIENTATION=
MGRRSRGAATKDARTMPKREESVGGMGQSAGNAATKDARTMPNRKEF